MDQSSRPVVVVRAEGSGMSAGGEEQDGVLTTFRPAGTVSVCIHVLTTWFYGVANDDKPTTPGA
jgi:hypothetical protein